MDSSPTDDNTLPCSAPLVQRRARPNHEQPLKCPRCESTHTKFCYYNNYNLTQPRYFCKTCRRYWTNGGTLRNIPVGGGCRKSKKVLSNFKKPSSSSSSPMTLDQSQTATDLHLAFPEQLLFSAIHGAGSFNPENTGFLFENMSTNSVECMGMENTSENFQGNNVYNNHHPFGLPSFDRGTGIPGGGPRNILESYQRLMLPYDENNHHQHYHLDQNNHHSDAVTRDTFGYNLGELGSWTGMMSGYESSATNPLV